MNSKDKLKLLLIRCFLFLFVCALGGLYNIGSNPNAHLNITAATEEIPDLFFGGVLKTAVIIIALTDYFRNIQLFLPGKAARGILEKVQLN